MIKFRRFSKSSKSNILDTNSTPGFRKGRKYDTDMDRLSRSSVQNEMSTNQLNKELENARKELKTYSMATYILKRKTYGVIDAAGNVVEGTVNTARNVAGSTISGVGGVLDSGAGKAAGGVAGGVGALSTVGAPVAATTAGLGAAGGAALGSILGPIGAGVGAVAGGLAGGIGGAKATYDAGSAIGSSATQAVGEGIKGIGNSIKAN